MTFELFEHAQSVAIEPQVFGLLLHFVENPVQVLPKDALIEAIWNGRSISDTPLSSRIFSVRRAVGDTGEAQAVIRTITRRGFRFVAQVSQDDGQDGVAGVQRNGIEPDQQSVCKVSVMHPRRVKEDKNPATVPPTLVLLPFKNASSGLDRYFCDGLTEDIISNLTHFRKVRVIVGSASFRFKERNLTFAEIAAKVGADYIVEGNVQRALNQGHTTGSFTEFRLHNFGLRQGRIVARKRI